MSDSMLALPLASRSARLKAALVDRGLSLALGLVGYAGVLWSVLAFLAWVGLIIYQLTLLARDGETIGKRMFHIRIVDDKTGEAGGFVPNVLLRLWVTRLLDITLIFFLVDRLFIYREDQRCIHDWIAGTRVVDLSVPVPETVGATAPATAPSGLYPLSAAGKDVRPFPAA